MPSSKLTAVIKFSLLDCQVCVPGDYSDDQIKDLADNHYPCDTKNGWVVRKHGHRLLGGELERVPCEQRAGFVHVMLDA